MAGWNPERKAWVIVILTACFISLGSARPFAGGWNDGSRLATVESLVDRHTLAIDDSIFVNVPSVEASPYDAGLMRDPRRPRAMLGTFDKLLIDGRYYSDKSPVPALLLALLYQLLQWTTGLTALAQPRAFCYLMTIFSSGLAYVVAVGGVFYLARKLQLPMRLALGVTASFALGTLALVYVRYVNNHMLLLGVTVALLACHAQLAQHRDVGRRTLLALGALAGFAYTIDLGVGPPLLACSFLLAAWRTRSLTAVVLIALAALPWLTVHHGVNYAIGGTFKPANAVAEYLAWPDSPFTSNLTGQWNHAGAGRCVSYAAQLLVGKKGFLGHNLPLLLAIPGAVYLLRKGTSHRPEVLLCLAVTGGVWLVYAVGSTNYAGACLSIRWFVPLIGLGYFVLIVFLRELPEVAADLAILTGGGVALMLSAWAGGPFRMSLLPAYWPIVAATLVAWSVYRWRVGMAKQRKASADEPRPTARAA